ncbi:ROK family protein [Streptococcus suis]|uniref:ROK family protein n=1 Tax=Streptococcus suis TaxID=1307 RepID=UPI0038BD5E1B
MAVKYALGVDIGGTKVAVGLVDGTGHVAYSLKVPSNKESSETLFQCVCTAIRELLNSQQLNIEDVAGIGVGLPGKVDVENGVAVFQHQHSMGEFSYCEATSKRIWKYSN